MFVVHPNRPLTKVLRSREMSCRAAVSLAAQCVAGPKGLCTASSSTVCKNYIRARDCGQHRVKPFLQVRLVPSSRSRDRPSEHVKGLVAVLRRKVCLFGIDGVSAEIAITERGMPHLAELADSGSHHSMYIEPPTLSGPSWSTILTGAVYAEHGVYDNSFVGKRLAANPDLLSRAFYADQTATTFAAASWPPLVEANGLGPIIQERREQKVAGLHRVVVRDGETNGYLYADAQIMAQSRWMLANEGPDVNFIYFCSADDAGHLFGTRSDEYDAALQRIDAHLKVLTDCIRTRVETLGEEWLVVVTTDHGHLDEGGHGGATEEERQSFVVTNRFGRDDVAWPDSIQPTQLTPLILEYLRS